MGIVLMLQICKMVKNIAPMWVYVSWKGVNPIFVSGAIVLLALCEYLRRGMI
jgi:hypothetical protein